MCVPRLACTAWDFEVMVQPPGLERGARLGRGFVSLRIRSDSLLFASRTAADPHNIQECISVLGKLLELGVGDKHQHLCLHAHN